MASWRELIMGKMWDRGGWFFNSSELSGERPPQGSGWPALQYLIQHHHRSLSKKFNLWRLEMSTIVLVRLVFGAGLNQGRHTNNTHIHTNTHWVFEGVPTVWCSPTDQSGAGDVSYVQRWYPHPTSFPPVGKVSGAVASESVCVGVINTLYHHHWDPGLNQAAVSSKQSRSHLQQPAPLYCCKTLYIYIL